MDETLLKLAEIGRAAVDFRRAELSALSTPTTLLQLNGAQRLGSAELSKLRSERNRLIREYIEQHPEGE